MAKASMTVKTLCKLAAGGRSDALAVAVTAGFATNNAKVQALAAWLAGELGLALPLDALLTMATQRHLPEEAERLARAIAVHRSDEAVDAMVDSLRAATPESWQNSSAALGQALRFVANPRATDRLLAVVEASDGALRERAAWALRGRRPRDPRAAALGAKLASAGDKNGKLLHLGHAEPESVLDSVEEVVSGALPASLLTFRPDIVAGWISSYARRALEGDAVAAERFVTVAASAKGFSPFRGIFKEDIFGPPLTALAQGGSAELVEAACLVYQWLVMESATRSRFFEAALARLTRGEAMPPTLARILHTRRHDPAVPVLADVLASRDRDQAENAAWALEGQDPALACAALDATLPRALGADQRDRVARLREKLGEEVPSDERDELARVLEASHVDALRAALAAGADANQVLYDGPTQEGAGIRPLHLLLHRFDVERARDVAEAASLLVAAGADPRAVIEHDVASGDDVDAPAHIKLFAGDTPVRLAMRHATIVGRPLADAIVSALGADSTDACLQVIAESGT